jgi:tetratricopeptide (TPR) repeat protein
LSTGFRSSPDAEHPAPLEPLERQQATLLAALRDARGAPVSYAELRHRGIEFPATIVSELALLGVPVERCHGHGSRTRRAVAVRLDPARDHRAVLSEPRPDRVDHAAAPARDPRADTRPLEPPVPAVAGRATTRALLAAVALAAVALGALLLVALGAGTGGAGAGPSEQRTGSSLAAAANAPRAPVEQSARASPQAQLQTQAQSQAQPQLQTQTQVAPVSATLATQLEARGHELLNAGQYADAVPVLRRALSATGESLRWCVRPASEQCLTYAYALYDLGRALLLSGSPVAAVGVLEHRLRIENQQPVVAAELASARRRLG